MLSNLNHSRNIGLDVLRCFAILFVLFAHTSPYIITSNAHEEVATYFGFLGVEIFFVLSGFLIGSILFKLPVNTNGIVSFKTIKNFWVRRWFRTLPNYYLVLLIFLFVYYFFLHENLFTQWKYLAYFVFLQNTFTPHPGFFSAAWSLSIEEWFYLLFPLILICFQNLIKNNKYNFIFAAFSIIIICTGLRIYFYYTSSFAWDNFRRLMPLRLDGIGIGLLLVAFKNYRFDFWQKNKTILFVIGLLFFAVFSFYFYSGLSAKNLSGIFNNVFLFTGFSIAFALLFPFMYNIKTARSNIFISSITQISLISYSIYLSHSVIIRFTDTVAGNLSGYIKFSLVWIATLIIAAIQYQIIEKPFLKLRDKVTKPDHKKGII